MAVPGPGFGAEIGAGTPAGHLDGVRLDGTGDDDDTVCMKGVTRSGVVLAIVGAFAGVLVVIAIVLALQPAQQLEPGTPEATIQSYLQAVIDGDQAEAARFMTPVLVQRCDADLTQIRHAPGSFRAVIVDTQPYEDEVVVTVEITEGPGAGLLGDSYAFEASMVVEQVGEDWLIAEAPWPIYCRET